MAGKGKGRGRKAKGNGDATVFDKSAAGAHDTDQGPQGEPGENVQAVVDAAVAEIEECGVEVAKLNEQKKALNKKIAAAYRRIKSVAGIDRQTMEHEIAFAGLSKDDQEKHTEQRMKAWQLLRLGTQAALFGGDAPAPQPRTPEPVSVKTARAAGREAGRAGKGADANPHAHDSDQGVAWEAGRGEGMIDNLPEPSIRLPADGDPFGPAEGNA